MIGRAAAIYWDPAVQPAVRGLVSICDVRGVVKGFEDNQDCSGVLK